MATNLALAEVIEMKPKSKRDPHKRKYCGADRPSFSVEQLKSFLHAADTFGRRELAMFIVGFAHGLRASEIADLRISDIDFAGGKILIRRLKDSNNSRPAMQRVNGYDEAFLLERWIKERAALPGAADSDVLFLSQKPNAGGERKLDRSQIYRIFVAVCEAAGISKEYQHPHALRHSAGQILYDQGARLEEIQQVLGHRSISSVTIYARPRQDEVNKKVAQIFKKIF